MKAINISIVEDNNLFRLALKSDIETVFASRVLNIRSFDSGEACMKSMKEQQPDIVILDYHLNGNDTNAANGSQVLNSIKKINPEICVIMLSSNDNIDVALQSFKSGASDYVVKTETQFRKINYSLMNQFKIMEAKSVANRYKYMIFGLLICVALLTGGVIAIQIFSPALLR